MEQTLKKLIVLLLAATLSVSATFPQSVQAQDKQNVQKPKFYRHSLEQGGIPGQYSVIIKRSIPGMEGSPQELDSDLSHVTAIARQLVQRYGGKFKEATSGTVFSLEISEEAAIRMSQDDRVELVDQSQKGEPGSSQQTFDPTTCSGGNPPRCNWGLDRMDQRYLPLNNKYIYNTTGIGVTAYIVDSGVLTTHAEFASSLGSRASQPYDRYSGANGVPSDGAGGRDCTGHGSGVASIVGGNTIGVAKGISVVSVRVFPCNGKTQEGDIDAALTWVRANARRPAVVNMSLEFAGGNPVVDNAVTQTINAGIPVVIAAGNNNVDASTVSPARVTAALTISGTDISDNRGTLTNGTLFNYGYVLDLFAAGEAV